MDDLFHLITCEARTGDKKMCRAQKKHPVRQARSVCEAVLSWRAWVKRRA